MSNLNGKAAHNHVRGDSFPGFEFDETPAATETAEFDVRKFEAETERLREQAHRIEIESRYALEMFEAETERRRQEAGHAEAAGQRELERMRLEAEQAEAPVKAAALAAAIGAVERITLAAIEGAKATAIAATEAEVKIAATPESYKLRTEAQMQAHGQGLALIDTLLRLGAMLAEHSMRKPAVVKKAAVKVPPPHGQKVPKRPVKKAAKKVAKTASKKPVKKGPAPH